MAASVNQGINKLLQRVAVRAEVNTASVLERTFVEVEQIANGLRRLDHQVIYGRRGTGKTHAFANLAAEVDRDNDLAIYVDLRKIGSNDGLYADSPEGVALRAAQLLIDVIESVHSDLLFKSVEDPRFEAMFPLLDDLASAATEVKVAGPVTVESQLEEEESTDHSASWSLTGKIGGAPSLVATQDSRKKSSAKAKNSNKLQRTGDEVPRLLFGRLGRTLEAAVATIAPHRVWILLDEWSNVPIELQPVLADMLRRTFFPCQGLTVKIGAVERRSRFIVRSTAATYTGLELGADTAAALNLDEYLLASESTAQAEAFFAQLFSRHICVLAEDLGASLAIPDPGVFVRTAFDEGGFKELVRASEGVPRDAINIASLAAAAAGSRAIRVRDVQHAARKYYLQDKEAGIATNPAAQNTWSRILREVVADRRSRTFLVRRNRDNTDPTILDLYDARLIHLLKAGLSTPGRPGVGYDGYAVDYGSYVHAQQEDEAGAAWGDKGRPVRFEREYPWIFRDGEPFLPDRFDEGVIFTPGKTNAIRERNRRGGF
ncbi:MAG: hypothetical protein JWO98_3322 [Frankiales bacterium]|nr:hypothetical protein [Frankiales bacterium]